MNPEFQRNVWLNLSSGRLITMPVVLGAIFFAVGLVPFDAADQAVKMAAEAGYWLIVVIWGTYLSARTVVSEIRERTWDGQRMSAIAPWSMVWGKLFGSTIFVWYGGAICIGVLFVLTLQNQGAGAALSSLAYYVLVGVFAQAVAMLASLLAVRRQLRHPGFGVFIYQLLGVLAAFQLASLWPDNWPAEVNMLAFTWFGIGFDVKTFVLSSIAIFGAWAIVGNHRLMRQELQFTNSPLVWIAFLAFVMLYFAGLADAIEMAAREVDAQSVFGAMDLGLLVRFGIGMLTAMTLAYVMLFLDSKDIVTLRWIGRKMLSGNLIGAASRVPSWGWAIAATGLMALLLTLFGRPIEIDQETLNSFNALSEADFIFRMVGPDGAVDWRPLAVASFLFLLRDAGIVLIYNATAQSRRADFAAFVTLVVLYMVLPAIAGVAAPREAQALFAPTVLGAAWLTVIPPAVEAGLAWLIVIVRMNRVRAPEPA